MQAWIKVLVRPLSLFIYVILLVPLRIALFIALRKRYPNLSINELVDACIKLTSFNNDLDD